MRLGVGSYTYSWAIGVPGHPPDLPMTAVDLLNTAAGLGVHGLGNHRSVVRLNPVADERVRHGHVDVPVFHAQLHAVLEPRVELLRADPILKLR